jgi:hypothetical protein
MRHAVLATLALAVPAATSSAQTIEPLIVEGDALGPFLTAGRILDFAVNEQGAWTARVSNPVVWGADLLLVDGEVELQTSKLYVPLLDVVTNMYPADLDPSGVLVVPMDFTWLPSGLFRDGAIALDAEDVLGGLPWRSFSAVAAGGDGALLVRGTVELPAHGYEVGALAKVTLDPSGALLAQEPLAIQGLDLLGLGTCKQLSVTRDGFALDADGGTVFAAETATGGCIVVDGSVLAKDGDPSPLPGSTLEGLAGASVDRAGEHVAFTCDLSPHPNPRAILRDGELVVREGGFFPAILPYVVESIDAGVRVTERGEVFWRGTIDYGDPAIAGGLFRDERRIVQEGVSTVDGVAVQRLDSPYWATPFEPDASPDGRYVAFWAELADGREGVFRLDLGAAEPVPGCLGNPGSLALMDSLLVPGGEIALALDAAQAPGALAFAAVSNATLVGASGCGIALPGFGEILIDLAPPHLLLLAAGGAWDGAAVEVTIVVPADPVLAGLELFAQGAFVDVSATPSEPLRVTNGLALVLGS